MRAGGQGFVWFAKLQPDTPGKLTAHSVSYEALELGSYEALLRVAMLAGDHETTHIAREIREDERRMLERLEGAYDEAVEASLRVQSPDDLREQLVKYLADAHALENQAEGLLSKGPELSGGDEQLSRVFEEHLAETKEHARLVEERLGALGGSPSRLKDVAMRMGALNWAGFFGAHPDTPGKLAVFAFAFEHLEIGGYEQLKRVARRAGDEETAAVAERILGQEREAARKLWLSVDHAVKLSLNAVGVTVG
jgi:ferritin-like metal-binding protein YciE